MYVVATEQRQQNVGKTQVTYAQTVVLTSCLVYSDAFHIIMSYSKSIWKCKSCQKTIELAGSVRKHGIKLWEIQIKQNKLYFLSNAT